MSEHHDSMRAQERENVDPEERIRPIPLAAVLVTLGMVVFGVLYIFLSEPLTNSRYGDERTLADLAGPQPGAAGGKVDGKAFAATMKGAKLTWTDENLTKWVSGPAKMLPGNKMAFGGIAQKSQIADVVAYLDTLK